MIQKFRLWLDRPPDLFVEELTRECIEAVIADLLEKGDLAEQLNPSVYVVT